MHRHEVEQLCEIIVPGSGALQIDALSRGLAHESLRVVRDGRVFALRLSVADGEIIALDRTWEACLLRVAGDAQLAPTLRFGDARRGILLSDWVEGQTWAERPVRGESEIGQVAHLLRRVHGLSIPQPAHRMSPADWVTHYDSKIANFPSRHRVGAAERLRAWAALPACAAVVCHGDLHALNLVQTGDNLRLLDWEYAHVSEAFWDLAGWSANGDFDDEAKHRLLSAYLGHAPNPIQSRRLELLAWLYDYICLQWTELTVSRGRIGPPPEGLLERAALLDVRLSIPAN